MASISDLNSAVKETLEHRGVLQEVKARLRAEVFHVLNDHQEQRPPLTNENILITELIREYLDFNNYKYTASVLQSESGQPTQKLDREFLKQELNVVEDAETGSVPLLYSIIGNYISHRKGHDA
ncbi:hypothetical protein CAPTEDRAFT_190202 [Capitella teleta]|uniref:Centrosomal protein 20 n=1 Tax=Capitella teleta TaxID=283909 RepID=R7VE31_CAPTE|nr:hypothetical protein CAPTEDRAFT_190202 [Capitella teleta]|eukprot:ELU16884.1 hypothetical protein CAPTEDRAFT_190202 [Capitella teleta]